MFGKSSANKRESRERSSSLLPVELFNNAPSNLGADLNTDSDLTPTDRIFLRFLREKTIGLNDTLKIQEQSFQDFLLKTKQLIEQKGIRLPKIFINYSWGDREAPEARIATRLFQDWLLRLQHDLQSLGIESFLDIQLMQGDMRKCMEMHLREGSYVLLVGTPSFKERATQDNLYLIPRADSNLFPTHGCGVVLVRVKDQEYILYYLEHGNLVKTATQILNLEGIHWIDKANGLKKARIGQYTNQVLEQVLGRKVNNLSFELGFALDKSQGDYRALIPLVYEGKFSQVFPEEVLDNLTRNFSHPPSYYELMAGSKTFSGLIPTMMPALSSTSEYKGLVQELEKKLLEIRKPLDSRNNQGQDCYNRKDFSQAGMHFEIAAEAGHREAKFNLGRCFYYGHGVPLDYLKAVHWYTLAALQGHPDAQNNLGNCYTKGKPTAEAGQPPYPNPVIHIDGVKAKYWFERAAQQGVCPQKSHVVPLVAL